MYTMSILILILVQTSVLALGYSENEESQVSKLRFSSYMFLVLGQEQVDCWIGWDETDAVFLLHE